jgi:hypothetical protein
MSDLICTASGAAFGGVQTLERPRGKLVHYAGSPQRACAAPAPDPDRHSTVCAVATALVRYPLSSLWPHFCIDLTSAAS